MFREQGAVLTLSGQLDLREQRFEDNVRPFNLTLPNSQDSPSLSTQPLHGLPVSFYIALKLAQPKIRTRFGQHRKPTPFMPVPETSVYKYTGPESREYNIRSPREVLAMEPKPVAMGMQKPSNDHLWLRVFSLDACHHAGPCGTINDVHSPPLITA